MNALPKGKTVQTDVFISRTALRVEEPVAVSYAGVREAEKQEGLHWDSPGPTRLGKEAKWPLEQKQEGRDTHRDPSAAFDRWMQRRMHP